jgi:hypothetical protein
MLQSTEEKKHLVLTLWSGEWFENMRSQELAGSASVPYRRETFFHKTIVIDFDGDFNMMDAGAFANNAKTKGIGQISRDLDSLNQVYDSIGIAYYKVRDMELLRITGQTYGLLRLEGEGEIFNVKLSAGILNIYLETDGLASSLIASYTYVSICCFVSILFCSQNFGNSPTLIPAESSNFIVRQIINNASID